VNSSRRLHTAGLLIAATAMLAACSDDGDASDRTTAPSNRPPALATEPSATTTSTSSTTSTTTTTLAPTTTVDQIAITKQAVADAAVASREAYLYAVYNLDAPDALQRLEATAAAGSDSLALALDNIETLRTNGWRARPHPDIPDSLTVESEVDLLDGPPATTAEVTVCVIGAGIVYEPAAAPDGSDTIVNDEITARRSRMTLVLENGSWKLSKGVGLGEWSGTSCPAA
jgi:hypothetical protein